MWSSINTVQLAPEWCAFRENGLSTDRRLKAVATTVVQCIVFCCTTKDTESTEACDDMLCTEKQVVARAIGWRLRSMRLPPCPPCPLWFNA